jgi:hypothetical protein
VQIVLARSSDANEAAVGSELQPLSSAYQHVHSTSSARLKQRHVPTVMKVLPKGPVPAPPTLGGSTCALRGRWSTMASNMPDTQLIAKAYDVLKSVYGM